MTETIITTTEVKPEEKPEERKGLQGIRWSWKKLEQAESQEEVRTILARVMEEAKPEVEFTLAVPKEVYVKIMGNAKLALYCGEIKEMSLELYIYRALQVMEGNIKAIWLRRRG